MLSALHVALREGGETCLVVDSAMRCTAQGLTPQLKGQWQAGQRCLERVIGQRRVDGDEN